MRIFHREGLIMKHWKLAGSTAFIALMSGSGAFADVTPEDVWQNWQDMTASYGQSVVAASAERDGDALVATGVKISSSQDGVIVDANIEEIIFTDNGDGTVDVTMSESYPIALQMPAQDDGDTPTNLTISVSQPGLLMTASGTPEATSYEFEAPTLTIKLEAIEGVEATAVDTTVEATLTKLDGQYLIQGAEGAKKVSSEFSAQSMALTVVGEDKEAGSNARIIGTFADLAGKTNGSFLAAEMMADLPAALKAGFAADGTFSYGAMSLDFDVTDAAGPTKMVATGEGGDMTFALDATKMQYGVGSKAINMTLTSPDIPFPELKLGYAEAAFNVLMPVGTSAEPTDFALLSKLVGFTISDEVWGMFDPAGNLPHDPATVIVDAKGKVKMTTDLMDTAAMEALGEGTPGELHALDVTEIKATIAGAELTGAGAFTFDNSDMTTFAGMPAPAGKLDLKLVGGNGLLDKLVAMGILTDEDAMGARMMVAMFANAGATGTDELTSTIEVKDKVLYANGQRLQ